MRTGLRMMLICLIGSAAFAACAGGGSAPILASPAPASTSPPATKAIPTPAAAGQTIVYADLQVTAGRAELSTEYVTEYGSSRVPPAGWKLLWVQVTLKNTGRQESALPTAEHFSVLDSASEYKATYGHRQNYPDYMALTSALYPGDAVTAWLRFDVPAAAELADLQFAFLPESFSVTFAFSPAEYAWGDHPVYLWRLGP